MFARLRLLVLCVLGLATLTARVGAHPMSVSEMRLWLEPGRAHAELALDAEERTADAAQQIRGVERALRSGLFLKIDGRPLPYAAHVRALGHPEAEGPAATDRIELVAEIPAGAQELSVKVTDRFGGLALRVVDPRTGRSHDLAVSAGSEAAVMSLAEDTLVGAIVAEPPAEPRSSTFLHYGRLGFEHILPLGLDHVLFVLALFFLSPRVRPLLLQLSAFTLAHSLTLGLVAAGVMSPPPALVEPLIAASIVFVGVENLRRQRLGASRLGVVVLFGLLHGMGFAGALDELGLPAGQEWMALVGFNLGVELGQVAVVLAALALTFPARQEGEHPRWVRLPASGAIALVGLVWTIERVLA